MTENSREWQRMAKRVLRVIKGSREVGLLGVLGGVLG